jgi:5-methylcytosine-specific restriction endonuclease McrA
MQPIADLSFFTEPYAFIDYNVLNDHVTSYTQTTARRIGQDFRDNIIERDGPFCIISQEPAEYCYGCHIIPRSKGDEVIMQVMIIRDPLMNPLPVHSCRHATSWKSL